MPLVPHPYRELAKRLGVTETMVLERLRQFQQTGLISRVGVVVRPRRVGVSTLAALCVPPDRLEWVAALVNTFPEVNHNYEREHDFNLWFVITAIDEKRLSTIVREIEVQSGLTVHSMPMEEDFHIDLGFEIKKDAERTTTTTAGCRATGFSTHLPPLS
ncbi:MAG: hypothetical protein H7837_05840 [Magnetococcus sp. MYC-9]